jgi:NADPH:quinone reductase-like Zn-dependent oxidoreductase/SAM-dependent methyltransferase
MMAVGAGADIVEPLLGSLLKGLAMIACYNSPNSVTVSGDIGAINELGPMLDKLGIFHRVLKVDVAYHSHHMPAVGYSYLDNITTIVMKNCSTPGKTRFFSSVNGMTANPTIVQSPWYWLANLISPVQFTKALQAMISSPDPNDGNRPIILVELGPHDALKGPVRQIIQHPQHSKITKTVEYMSTLKRGESESKSMLNTIASLINSGYPVEYSAVTPSTATSSRPLLLTDLPSYCFNKTKRYWQNSRFSEEFAHNTLPWNVLLGHNTPGSIGRGLAFRNVFKLDDIPWLRDHRINGTIIFPMTGYICMAIEAIRVTFQHQSKNISGYRLREIVLNKAFLLSEEATHDIYTIVQPQAQSTRASNSDGWFTFQIISWDASSGFSEHCRGSIAIDSKSSQDTFDGDSVRSLWEARAENLISQAFESLHCEATPETLYHLAELEGLQYGPAFRLLSRIRQGEGFSLGTVRCGDPGSSMPLQYHNQLVIHPTILDAVFHVGFRFRDGHDDGPESLAVSVPNFLQEAYISNDIPQQTGSEIEVLFHDYKGEIMTRTNSASATCFVAGSKSPIMEFRNAKGFEIGKTDIDDPQGNMLNPLEIEWQKHPLLLASGYLEEVVSCVPPIPTELQELRDLEQVSYYLIEEAISVPRLPPAKKHLRQLQSWMEQCVAQVKSSQPKSAQGQWGSLNVIERQQFIEKTCSKTTLGAAIAKIGQQLGDILEETADPLSVLIGKGDLWDIYDESYLFKRSSGQLAQIVGLLSLHNPSLRILEVGAGTGGCTVRVLEELSSITSLGFRFHSYDYTDISPGFFEAAMAKFQKYKARMTFKRFDLSQDPVEQGFSPASYDLVIAADVIHATPDISQSLRHIRELLKPDGVLAMVELAKARPIMFPFATLPGWWSREDGPVVSRSEWKDLLLQSGFTGLDEAITDFPDWQNHFTFLSRAACTSTPLIQPVTVVSDRSPPQILMKNLEHLIQKAGGQFVGHQPMSDACKGRGIFVCLDEIWGPYLATASQEMFDHFRRLICKARGILWVTKPLRRGSLDEPMLDFAFGFARTLSQENAGLKLVVLQLGPEDDTLCTMNIMNVFEHAFITKPGTLETDLEYKVIDGRVHIPRIVPDNKTRGAIEQETTDQPVDGEKLWQAGRSHHLNIGYVGLLNTLHFQPHAITEEDQALAPDEVLFEVKAAGMNFKDVLVALGSVPWEPLGKECSGVVIAAGKAARAQYKVGDSIVALGTGFLSTHVRCNVRNVSKMPKVLNYAEAASIPVVYVTAYESLVNVAHLKRGEKILIHAAAGGVGQAAITVAQWIGAEIFCTVGTAFKKNHIMDVYGIPESHIFSSRSSLFAKGVTLATASYGLDVILNSFSGEALRESWQCLAPFGRFVDIGKRSFLENTYLESAPFDKAVSFHAVDLALLMRNRADYVHRVMAEVMEHVDSGDFQLIQPIQTVPVTDIESCMRTIQAGKHVGKIIVMFDDKQALVKARRPSWEVNPIRQDASYIITGGAGGLGRSLAKWLVGQGATSIVLAARRGSEGVPDPKIQELRELSEANGAEVQFVKCDVGSITDVRKLVEALPRDKPVRGVIHGAMSLKVCLN